MANRNDRLYGIFAIAALVLVPLFYVASAGPVLWLGQRGHLPDFVVESPLYAPIVMVCTESPPLADAMTWYLSLWGINATF